MSKKTLFSAIIFFTVFAFLFFTETVAIQAIGQEFNQGIQAINFNKPIYLPGETTYLQLAVLENDGSTVCDANLSLEIKSPNSETEVLTTKTGTIQYSGKCQPENITDTPDYFAFYKVKEIGVYQLKLKNLDNGFETVSSFEVRDSVPFEIERIGPTRIYPPAEYEMKIKIKANEDFEGEIKETVPSRFSLVSRSQKILNYITSDGIEKTFGWQADFEKGKTYEFYYKFSVPGLPPSLYFLGPLEIGQFKEERNWQIAADASSGPNSPLLAVDDSTAGTVAWTNVTNVFTSDNLYATAALGLNKTSHYIKATNFGFGIPSGNTINGILVEVEAKASQVYVTDAGCKIVKGGNIVGTAQNNWSYLTGSDAYYSFGGSTNLWGTTLLYSDINDIGFGVACAYFNDGYNGTITTSVDHIRITVYYTPAAVTPPTVDTLFASSITSSSAFLNGNITNTNGQNADQIGFDIGTASGTYNLTGYLEGTFGGPYVYPAGYFFDWQKTGLNPSTTYYFRAKAHNSAGWTYAPELNFPTSAAGDFVVLPVNSFPNGNLVRTGWTKTGSSPYLDVIDFGTNYIRTNVDSTTGDYGFLDSADLGTITKVEIGFYYRWSASLPDNFCVFRLQNNGATWVNIGGDDTGTSWHWQTFDVTSVASLVPWTWTKVNNALAYLDFHQQDVDTSAIQVDAVRLTVYYTPVGPPPTCTPYNNPYNVYGWAWSENIGWISFNSKNCDSDSNCLVDDPSPTGCPPANTDIPTYGVFLDTLCVNCWTGGTCPTTCPMSGYAWAGGGVDGYGNELPIIGWIKFNPLLSDLPVVGPMYWPSSAVWNNDFIWGFIRACAGAPDPATCSGVGSNLNSGGWDGFIALRKLTDFGVELIQPSEESGEFYGWAWGGGGQSSLPSTDPNWGKDAVVGWISFNCKNQFCVDSTSHRIIDYSCNDDSCFINGGTCRDSCNVCDNDPAILCEGDTDCGSGNHCIQNDYSVKADFANQPPDIPTPLPTEKDCCSATSLVAKKYSLKLSWDYHDTEDDDQYAYEIWIWKDGEDPDIDPKFNYVGKSTVRSGDRGSTTIALSNDEKIDSSLAEPGYSTPSASPNWPPEICDLTNTNCPCPGETCGRYLKWGQTYHWKVRVKEIDAGDEERWSDWSAPVSFIMDGHPGPSIDFSWCPEYLDAYKPIQFCSVNDGTICGGTSSCMATSETVCYNNALGDPSSAFCNSWEWTFQDAFINDIESSPAYSTNINPLNVRFQSSGFKDVDLTVYDSLGLNCVASKPDIFIGLPLPEWREIPPTF